MSEMEPLPNVVEPAGQGVHAPAESRPMLAPYVPVGHGTQSLCAVADGWFWYVPCGQGMQAAGEEAAELGLYVPASHAVQVALPDESSPWYVPAGQGLHRPVAASSTHPAWQSMQLDSASAPSNNVPWPAGQLWHST